MITGLMFKNAIISASNNINNHSKDVDALNVFPVPDGDTGTNMSMTMSAAAREVSVLPDNADIGTVADTVASALLRGARGNSGVILSLIFRGLSKGLKGLKEAGGKDIAKSLSLGVEMAYKAVMKPTEGTILTVVRLAAEGAKVSAENGDSEIDVWNKTCDAACDTLKKTTDMLPVLKKAGVVDAGGQGLVFIFLGMQSLFKDGVIISGKDNIGTAPETPKKEAVANADEEIKFGYCSEFLISKDRADAKSAIKLRAYLESIGDCVVVVDDDDIIKVHVHSNEPGNVIQAALEYGSLNNIKIDNMRHQHRSITGLNKAEATKNPAKKDTKKAKSAPKKNNFGFVAVAAGEGLENLFKELGADNIVSGGQTMNPSTDDLLNAVMQTPAKHVFILPNNKNIIMAAEQVSRLADRKVSVLPTTSVCQGITAMLNFDESISAEENHINMMHAAQNVGTAQITFAARDSESEVDGQPIKKGQILGLENGKITVVDDSIEHAAFRTTKRLFTKKSSLITIIYGKDSSEEQAETLQDLLTDKFPNAEISIINGGQPVYYFIISVE